MTDAVVAGHICLDIIPDLANLAPGQFDQAFKPGMLVNSGPAKLSTGGAVSNTGIAMHILGIDTRLIARVGDDQFGNTIKQMLGNRKNGLDSGIITSGASSTSYTIVVNPPGSDRRFLHHPGANNDFCAADINEDLVKDARLFHFGYPPLMSKMYSENGQQLAILMKGVKSLGLTTSLDMAFPDPESESGKADWPGILKNTLPYTDIFVPSFEEISFMLKLKRPVQPDLSTLRVLSDQLLEMGAKMVMLKLGDKGVYLKTGPSTSINQMTRTRPNQRLSWAEYEAWLPCFSVNVKGTTGAGDVTVAGFLTGLINGLSLTDALYGALAVGANCVEATDALSGLRSWENTWERINSGWQMNYEPHNFIR